MGSIRGSREARVRVGGENQEVKAAREAFLWVRVRDDVKGATVETQGVRDRRGLSGSIRG